MEWHVVQLKADIDTREIIESHWTLLHVDTEFPQLNISAYRFGMVAVPPEEPEVDPEVIGNGEVEISSKAFPQPYDTITEEEAIEGTKVLLGPETVAALEQSCLDEVEAKKHPETISGTPWVPPIPPGPGPGDPILDNTLPPAPPPPEDPEVLGVKKVVKPKTK